MTASERKGAMEIEKRTLTLREAAQLLGVSPRVLRKAIDRGQIPAFRLGRSFVVPRAPLEAMLRATRPVASVDEQGVSGQAEIQLDN